MATPLAYPVYTLGSWAGNVTDDFGVDWVVEKESGWSSPPPVRAEVAARPDTDGSFPTPTYYGTRVVTLSGRALAPSNVEMLRAKDRLARVILPRQSQRLTVDEAHMTRWADVRLSDAPLASDEGARKFSWQLTVAADDPRRYGAVQSARVRVTANIGGITYPLRYPAKYGLSVGGDVALSNEGTAETWPVFRVGGGTFGSGFTITERATGARLTYDGALNDGDVLMLDSRTGAAVLNGTGDVRHRLIDRGWWSLPGGASAAVLLTSTGSYTGSQYVTGTYAGSPYVTVEWSPAWW